MRNWYFLLLLTFVGCVEKAPPLEEIPVDAVEILQIEDRSTYLGRVSFYFEDRDQYLESSCLVNNQKKDFVNFFTLDDAGYYELSIYVVTSTERIEKNYQIVILDEERGESEWGIPKFTPAPYTRNDYDLQDLKICVPAIYPNDINIPIIIQADSPREEWVTFYDEMNIAENTFNVKHGFGSTLLSPREINSETKARANGSEKQIPFEVIAADYIEVKGSINSNDVFEQDKFYHITDDLTIESSVVLQIPSGCIFKIDQGVNIYNFGQIKMSGTATNPIVFACTDPTSYWGGIISSQGTSTEVNHAIFAQAGFNDSEKYQYGHAKRQAVFYHDDSDLILKNVSAIDNAGQVFFVRNQSYLNIDNSAFQRAITAGEAVNSTVLISNSTFTDFPAYTEEYEDKDNDCLYLDNSNATISNSSFMYAKDDGIDTGGSGGGTVTIDDCHFEGIFHEGIAMSSSGEVNKSHVISSSTFINNGQGVELGYSSINHDVIITDCTFERNMIGVRYGDNYPSEVNGHMELSDCSFSGNFYQDIRNFVRKEWGAIDENLVY